MVTDYRRWVNKAVAVVGITMAVYHQLSARYFLLPTKEHWNVHLGFALLLIFLVNFRDRSNRRGKIFALAFAIASLISVSYIGIFYDAIEMRAMFNTTPDLIIGAILILVVIVATRYGFGVVLPVIAVMCIAYFLLGHYLPYPFHIRDFPVNKIISALSVGLTGIYGVPLGVSANYVFLFIIFGSILRISGATGFFTEFAKLVGRRVRSGPAMSAVVTSALMGTTTGSIGANILTTGSFTIPLMKNIGYKPEQAGAIEAAASGGGQIMPPVMGAAAFVMVSITGISYLNIMIAALIPALLYFSVVGLYVHFQALKLGISATVETVDLREMLLRAPLFLVPVGLIIYLLVLGKPLMFCVFWAIISAIILSLVRKETRPTLHSWVDGITSGAIVGAQAATACACLGMILRTLTATGIGIKLPALVELLSGGNLHIALSIVAVVSIFLGMEVSTIGVYILVAIVTAPVLVKMGVDMLQAHFFVFFYACFSMLTPPVGMGSILASKVAGAKYIPTAIEAVKASIAGFVIPFLIIWNPVLLFQSDGSPLVIIVLRLAACAVLLFALEASVVGYCIGSANLWERVLLGLSVVGIIGYFITQSFSLYVLGIGLVVAVIAVQLGKAKIFKVHGWITSMEKK